MSREIIIVAKCIKTKEGATRTCDFSFRGVYKGKKIKKIRAVNTIFENIKSGNDYILFVDLIEIPSDIIICTIKKYRELWS